MKVIDLIIKQFNFELEDKTIFRILNQTGHNKYIYNIDDNQFNEYRDRGGELKNILLVIDNETVNWDIEIIEEDRPIEQLNLFYNDNHKEYTLEDIKDKGACIIVTERATHILVIKINEIIDQLNELKKVGSK